MEKEAEKVLDNLLEKINADSLEEDQATLCGSLLSRLDKQPDLVAKICEVLAELGKNVDFRTVAETCSVLPSIVPLLSSDQLDVRLQAMRAVGNLCFDHDTNREAVLISGGCPYLITQLKRCSDVSTDDSRSARVKAVTCGCVLNLTNNNEKLQTEFNSLHALNCLSVLISLPNQEEAVLDMALNTVTVLLEQADLTSLSPLPAALVSLFPHCFEDEIDLLESVLDIIELLVNKNDSLKRALVTAGCVDQLLLVPAGNKEEQKTNDIIVSLLADDECLDTIFKGGKVLSYALAYLESETSTHTQRANAALLVANMARTEDNCRVLVEQGVVPHLVALLKEEESKEMLGKLHHSSLSALRNLSLPVAHKEMFLSCGVVEGALSLLFSSSVAHVWFKVLGVLRLLVDGQAATCSYIVSREGSVKRVCEVCSAIGPEHIRLEGSRLLAAIIKNCQNKDVMCDVVKDGGVHWVLQLLDSTHTIMTNEGLLALNLLAGLSNDGFHSTLCESDSNLAPQLSQVLKSKAPELVSNALRLLEILLSCNHDELKQKLRSNEELTSSLEEIAQHSDENIVAIAQKILINFKSAD